MSEHKQSTGGFLPVDIGWLSYKSSNAITPYTRGMHDVITNYHNQKNEVPFDFDWQAYRSLNPDLAWITSYQDAVKHFKVHGMNQVREYKYSESQQAIERNPRQIEMANLDRSLTQGLPEDFDWLAYRSLNPDLASLTNIKDAVRHYRDHGQGQHRPYKFDPTAVPHITTEYLRSEQNLLSAGIEELKGFNEITSKYLNQSNGIPENFDWHAYKNLNPDLGHIKCYQDAVKHFRDYGQREGRPFQSGDRIFFSNDNKYSLSRPRLFNLDPMPKDFNWVAYRALNPDLMHLQNFQEASRHYQEHGRQQNRPYKKIVNHNENVIIPSYKVKDYDWITYQTYGSAQNIPAQDRQKAGIPADFNWIAYKSLNSDLRHISSWKEAVKHYAEHGYRQNRPYRFNDPKSDRDTGQIVMPSLPGHINPNVMLPVEFNWQAYRDLNSDLGHLTTIKDAVQHYLEHGYNQNRPYQYPPNHLPNNSNHLPNNSNHLPNNSNVENYGNQYVSENLSEEVAKQEVEQIQSLLQQYTKVQLPPDFDWLAYKYLNADLSHFKDQEEAIRHYMDYGHRESRVYKGVIPQQTIRMPELLKDIQKTQYQNKVKSMMPHPIKLTNYKLPRIGSNIISPGRVSNWAIPNIIHFIYGFKKNNPDLELFKYIAIKSAIEVNRPDQVFFYYKYEPTGPYWEKIKPLLTLRPVEPPQEIFGNKIEHFAHQSDVMRLKVLNEFGGIYLDIDTISLRPLNEFRNYEFVMGMQGDNYGLCNAVMMAKPQSEFGLKWYDSYRDFRGNGNQHWDEHSVKLPLTLSKQIPVTMLSKDSWFYPLWSPMPHILFNDKLDIDECRSIFANSYCIHLWESFMFVDYLKKFDRRTIMNSDTLYNLMARKFIRNQISIVMLTFNRSQKTIECIESFYNAVKRNDILEFIIFDNHSEESEIIEFLKKLPNINSKFRVIWSPENLGVCGGRIKLFKEVKGDIVASLDSDLSLIDEKFFDICVQYLQDESIGMVGASGAHFSKSFNFGSHKDVIEANENMFVDQLAGCCQVFRKDLVHFGVQLDAEYGKFWVEDADFCFQITNLGKRLLLIPQRNLVHHVWGGSGNGMPELFKKNWDYFTQKWRNHKHLCSLS
jgi:GT2 family glycosyltransferase